MIAVCAAPGSAVADNVCKRGRPYVSGKEARVVVANEHLWGCVRGQKRAHVVAYPLDFGDWRHVTVAGSYAALEIAESSQECESRDIRVVDLRSGRMWTKLAEAGGEASCGGHPVSDLVLRSDGLVAFIAGRQVIRWSQSRKRKILLDESPKVAPTSLGFERGGLRWTVDGRREHADLPKRHG
ncbi:MAG TPA: hypothetical protein VF533_13340 [Solirubrobacteraceae bacterium]